MESTLSKFLNKYKGIPSNSIRYRLASGTFWVFLGSVFSGGMTILSSIFCGRLLGSVGLGELGIITSTVSTFGVFAGLGLGTTTTKYVAEYKNVDPERAGKIIGLTRTSGLILSLFISILFFILSPLIANKMLNAPHLIVELQISCGLLFLNAVNGIQYGTLSGFEAFKSITVVNVVRGISNVLFIVVGSLIFDVKGALIGSFIAILLVTTISEVFLRNQIKRHEIKIPRRMALSETSILLNFSFPAFLSGVMLSPMIWYGNTLLVNRPGGYAEMGIFNATNQWTLILAFIPNIVCQVALPILSNLLGKKQISDYRNLLLISLGITLAVTIFFGLPIVVLAKYIMGYYGSGFEDGAAVLRIIIFSQVFASCSIVVGTGISSLGKMWEAFLLNLLWALSFCVLVQLFIPQGAFGLALAYFYSYTIHIVSMGLYLMYFLQRLSKQSNELKASLQTN